MSIKDLENDTGLSDRAITRAIGSMIQSGYLRKVPSPSKRPNLYFIEVAPFAEQAAKNRAEDSAHADATSEQEGDHV
jgi:DNA-binding MarR family transcriptional regulator